MANANTQIDNLPETIEEIQTEEPKKYCVILHNDDKTTFDCVIKVLQVVFHYSFDKAIEITNMVHLSGRGVAGVYTLEIAKEKTEEAMQLSRSLGYNLKVTYEEH